MQIISKASKRIIQALGKKDKELTAAELDKRKKFRRSTVASKTIKKGEVITEEDIVYKRPGIGISPDKANTVINMRAKRDIKADNLINMEDIS